MPSLLAECHAALDIYLNHLGITLLTMQSHRMASCSNRLHEKTSAVGPRPRPGRTLASRVIEQIIDFPDSLLPSPCRAYACFFLLGHNWNAAVRLWLLLVELWPVMHDLGSIQLAPDSLCAFVLRGELSQTAIETAVSRFLSSLGQPLDTG